MAAVGRSGFRDTIRDQSTVLGRQREIAIAYTRRMAVEMGNRRGMQEALRKESQPSLVLDLNSGD